MHEAMEDPMTPSDAEPSPETTTGSFSEHREEGMTPEKRVQLVESRYLGSPEKLELFTKECAAYARPIVRGVINGSSNLVDDFEDVVQEIVLKATLNLKRFAGESALTTWIYKIAFNEAVGFMRKQHAEMRNTSQTDSIDELLSQGEEFPMSDPTPEEAIIREGEASALYEAMDRLTPKRRMLVELFYFREYTQKEIEERFGIPISVIKTDLHRARQEMLKFLSRKKLKEHRSS